MKTNPNPKLTIVKIGGNVLDDESVLTPFLEHFAAIQGLKILIHGGGKLATDLAARLGVPQKMIDGRRVTDEQTLDIAAMVYGGLINKKMTARLQALGLNAIGVTGADGDVIRSVKRKPSAKLPHDFGFVGDITAFRADVVQSWLSTGLTPVVAPITHDGQGQLLNTNADTIASVMAVALSKHYQVTLIYSFEKSGVLRDASDDLSLIPEINFDEFTQLKAEGKIFAGMIPKLDNAFQSIDSGVECVILGKANQLSQLISGQSGTKLRPKGRAHV